MDNDFTCGQCVTSYDDNRQIKVTRCKLCEALSNTTMVSCDMEFGMSVEQYIETIQKALEKFLKLDGKNPIVFRCEDIALDSPVIINSDDVDKLYAAEACL